MEKNTKKKFREIYVSHLTRIFLPGLFKIFWQIYILYSTLIKKFRENAWTT